MTETHLHATVSLRAVLFAPGDDVLLVKRASDGEWELPGGRLNIGEGAVDGLRRELNEETGLEPSVDRPVHTAAWENDDGHGRFATYYRCYAGSRDVELSEEHTTHRWTAPEGARERLDGPRLRALERAVSGHEAVHRTAGRESAELTE